MQQTAFLSLYNYHMGRHGGAVANIDCRLETLHVG